MGTFKIDVDEFSWINGAEDDPSDRCLHGRVTVQIGQTVLQDVGTVSATALYLLKSLTEDKRMNDSCIQMIPCCGFFMIANPGLTEVSIIGCDTGTDWSVIHEDGQVKLVTESGVTEYVNLADYQAEVFRFADKVEAYYNACQPKEIPEDEFDRNGYTAFWNEWHRRRGEAAPIRQVVYNGPGTLPYSLHDSRISGIFPADGGLRLVFEYGYFSTQPPFEQVNGDILIQQADIDDCEVWLLSPNGGYGDFHGKKMTLADFLRDYPAFSFEVIDEMAGYHSVSYQGYLLTDGDGPLIETRFVIWYDGELIYRVQA